MRYHLIPFKDIYGNFDSLLARFFYKNGNFFHDEYSKPFSRTRPSIFNYSDSRSKTLIYQLIY